MIPYQQNAIVAAIVAPAPVQPAPTLDALASRIAGKPVHVICETWSTYKADPVAASIASQRNGAYPMGYAEPWHGTFTMGADACTAVEYELIDHPSGAGLPGGLGYVEDTRAVFTFFHESEHLAQYPDGTWSDEHVTDCRAIAAESVVLPELGLPSERVSWLHDAALAIHSLSPAPYAGPC